MTDAEVLAVKPGDVIRDTWSGRAGSTRRVAEVRSTGLCVNERSGAYGHAWALVSCYFPDESSTSRITFAIESDEYAIGSGYPTFDASGRRVRGHELVDLKAQAAAHRLTKGGRTDRLTRVNERLFAAENRVWANGWRDDHLRRRHVKIMAALHQWRCDRCGDHLDPGSSRELGTAVCGDCSRVAEGRASAALLIDAECD